MGVIYPAMKAMASNIQTVFGPRQDFGLHDNIMQTYSRYLQPYLVPVDASPTDRFHARSVEYHLHGNVRELSCHEDLISHTSTLTSTNSGITQMDEVVFKESYILVSHHAIYTFGYDSPIYSSPSKPCKYSLASAVDMVAT